MVSEGNILVDWIMVICFCLLLLKVLQKVNDVFVTSLTKEKWLELVCESLSSKQK